MSPRWTAIPEDALSPVDIYKSGRLAASMWRLGDTVMFGYRDDYVAAAEQPIAFTLPLSHRLVDTDRMRIPAFFAGLLPEGESRRRDLQRAFHLAEDDELGLLSLIGADTVGDVQVVPAGDPPPDDAAPQALMWDSVSLREMWNDLSGAGLRSALPGVQPKMSAQSRSLHGGAAGAVILKFPIESWRGVLTNERFFMVHAADVGLQAPAVAIVTDREGQQALEVVRFDRALRERRLMRYAQEDASQVLGLRPGQKYDPDGRTVVGALASRCASPKMAARDLFHQLVYSYVIGNNDVHAKNLSIRRDPKSSLWMVTPVYDVLHTWPYEGDHRFYPAVRKDGPHEAVTLKHWLQFASDVGLPERAARRTIARVLGGVPGLLSATRDTIDLSPNRMRDLERVLQRRVHDLQGG